jgi:predicted RNase H-like nuclease
MGTDTRWVAGVDGCRGGWIVVLRRLDDPGSARAQFVPWFEDVLSLDPTLEVIGVDMPIGLPPTSGIGGRSADVQARANLGPRQSAVFAVPSRSAVMCEDYAAACAAALATSDPPRKVSKQCFHLFPKIREIDELMSPQLQARVYETHPELAFWALNGQTPLTEAKKVKSRPHAPGLALRRTLLASVGYAPTFLETAHTSFRPSAVAPDDLLDAAVCSWTAARIARGEARRFPPSPPLDARGLRMEIWG